MRDNLSYRIGGWGKEVLPQGSGQGRRGGERVGGVSPTLALFGKGCTKIILKKRV